MTEEKETMIVTEDTVVTIVITGNMTTGIVMTEGIFTKVLFSNPGSFIINICVQFTDL